MAAMALGMPAVSIARAAAGKEPESGEGKGETLGKNVGMALGGVAGSAMPVVGSAVVGETLSRAGGLMGRGVDRLRGRNTSTPPRRSARHHSSQQRGSTCQANV